MPKYLARFFIGVFLFIGLVPTVGRAVEFIAPSMAGTVKDAAEGDVRGDATMAVDKVFARKAIGTMGEDELFSFEVYFQPNQNSFAVDMYADAFKKVMELVSTDGGAVITVEGHSDPLGYLRQQKEKSGEIVLRQIQQAARNLSLTRAIAVRDSIIGHAQASGVNLDQSQFTVIGHGITQPKTGMCGTAPCPPKTKEDWLGNMRVVFRIIQIEAEESAFRTLD